jgi:hypothetical protein
LDIILTKYKATKNERDNGNPLPIIIPTILISSQSMQLELDRNAGWIETISGQAEIDKDFFATELAV